MSPAEEAVTPSCPSCRSTHVSLRKIALCRDTWHGQSPTPLFDAIVNGKPFMFTFSSEMRPNEGGSPGELAAECKRIEREMRRMRMEIAAAVGVMKPDEMRRLDQPSAQVLIDAAVTAIMGRTHGGSGHAVFLDETMLRSLLAPLVARASF